MTNTPVYVQFRCSDAFKSYSCLVESMCAELLQKENNDVPAQAIRKKEFNLCVLLRTLVIAWDSPTQGIAICLTGSRESDVSLV